jgi:hypothetical protein
MKKIILLLAVVALSFSCSENDEETNDPITSPVQISYASLAGKWYFSSIINGDNQTVTFQERCEGKRDYVILTTTQEIYEYHFGSDNCQPFNENPSNGYYLVGQNFKGIIGGGVFLDAKVTFLSQNVLKIEYDNVKNYTDFSQYNSVKGAILTRF